MVDSSFVSLLFRVAAIVYCFRGYMSVRGDTTYVVYARLMLIHGSENVLLDELLDQRVGGGEVGGGRSGKEANLLVGGCDH